MNKTKVLFHCTSLGKWAGVTQRGSAELVVRGCRGAGRLMLVGSEQDLGKKDKLFIYNLSDRYSEQKRGLSVEVWPCRC